MKKNMGNMDRGIRVVIALALAGLYFTNVVTGTVAVALLVLAVVAVLTSTVGFCPIYKIFGTSTCPVEK